MRRGSTGDIYSARAGVEVLCSGGAWSFLLRGRSGRGIEGSRPGEGRREEGRRKGTKEILEKGKRDS